MKPHECFAATRTRHLQEAAEDYTELIADLIDLKGKARVCDIARHLGVTHVAALKAIQRLQRDGYVITSPHQPIVLTEKGRQLANFSKKRHEILLQFLIKIGVPKEIAIIDAEGLEHHISKETLQILKKHLD